MSIKPIDHPSMITLSSLAKNFRAASISEATKRAYQADLRAFLSFCRFQGLEPLPASPGTIEAYLSELASLGKSVATITRAVTALNKAHEIAGHGTIKTPDLSALLRGIRRSIGTPRGSARAITFLELRKLARLCDSTLMGRRDKALLMLGWCSAMRRSELVALNLSDLEFSERGLAVTIRRSKTDQDGQGRTIVIPFASDLCPVDAVQDWIRRTPQNLRSPETPLFWAVGNGGKRYWFPNKPGDRLSDRMVTIIVKRYARLAGLPVEKCSAHSLRRGLATEAGARGVPERVIARHTRHASISVLREYIESGNQWDENPLAAIYETRIQTD